MQAQKYMDKSRETQNALRVDSGLLDDAAAHHSRGVGVWRNFVYMETDDAHLLCLDGRSGNLRWDVAGCQERAHQQRPPAAGVTLLPIRLRQATDGRASKTDDLDLGLTSENRIGKQRFSCNMRSNHAFRLSARAR